MVAIIGILRMHRILTAGDRVGDDLSFYFIYFLMCGGILGRDNQVRFSLYRNHFLTFLTRENPSISVLQS